MTGRDDRADPPEKEVDNEVVLVDDVADPPPKGEVGFEAPEERIITESGREKLKELRKRMEAEKLNIINYLEVKKQDQIMPDISNLWRETWRQDPAWRKENQEDWFPTGWKDWWMCVEHRQQRKPGGQS